MNRLALVIALPLCILRPIGYKAVIKKVADAICSAQ